MKGIGMELELKKIEFKKGTDHGFGKIFIEQDCGKVSIRFTVPENVESANQCGFSFYDNEFKKLNAALKLFEQ